MSPAMESRNWETWGMTEEPKRKIAQAECFQCHEIWPKNEMTQAFAVSSTRSSISMRGSMSASTTQSRVWRCPKCQRKIDEVWERRSEVAAGLLLQVMKIGAVVGLLYVTKVFVFPFLGASSMAHMGAMLFRHHI